MKKKNVVILVSFFSIIMLILIIFLSLFVVFKLGKSVNQDESNYINDTHKVSDLEVCENIVKDKIKEISEMDDFVISIYYVDMQLESMKEAGNKMVEVLKEDDMYTNSFLNQWIIKENSVLYDWLRLWYLSAIDLGLYDFGDFESLGTAYEYNPNVTYLSSYKKDDYNVITIDNYINTNGHDVHAYCDLYFIKDIDGKFRIDDIKRVEKK